MLIFLLLSLGILGFYTCHASSEQDSSVLEDEYSLALVFVAVMLVMGVLDPQSKRRKGNRGCTIRDAGALCQASCVSLAVIPNSHFMVTPFKNASEGPKDAYNFFQSQLRIRVECGFGMFVKRWAMLRKPIPSGISLKRTISLVYTTTMTLVALSVRSTKERQLLPMDNFPAMLCYRLFTTTNYRDLVQEVG